MSDEWHQYFLRLCDRIAEKSKDHSTKVGCIIVGPDNEIRSTGFNGFPRGVLDKRIQENTTGSRDWANENKFIIARYDRPVKYFWTEHAERNAIYNAARAGIQTKGCILYLNFTPYHICADCARGIIQSGIVKVIGTTAPLIKKENQSKWEESFSITKQMFNEAEIRICEL